MAPGDLPPASHAARRPPRAERPPERPERPGAGLVPARLASGGGRHPDLRRPDGGRGGGQVSPADDPGPAGAHHRGRRRLGARARRAPAPARGRPARPRRAQAGFAANCNRGLRAVRPDEDAVLLNSDVIAHPGWLEVLQHAAHARGQARGRRRQAALPRLDDPVRRHGAQPGAPEWFDHRFRFRHADFAPASVMQPVLSVTGACMYVTRDTLDAVGLFDEAYGMAYEDVDYCLRVWESGRRVVFAPAATLTHFESKTRGMSRATASWPPRSTSGTRGATVSTAATPARRTVGCGSSTSPRTPGWAAGTGSSSSTSTGCSTAATTPSCGRSGPTP